MSEKCLLFVTGLDSSVRRALTSSNLVTSVDSGSNPPGSYAKNCEIFFLLIEKTLGNVSPCLELALSQSFNGTWE